MYVIEFDGTKPFHCSDSSGHTLVDDAVQRQVLLHGHLAVFLAGKEKCVITNANNTLVHFPGGWHFFLLNNWITKISTSIALEKV